MVELIFRLDAHHRFVCQEVVETSVEVFAVFSVVSFVVCAFDRFHEVGFCSFIF